MAGTLCGPVRQRAGAFLRKAWLQGQLDTRFRSIPSLMPCFCDRRSPGPRKAVAGRFRPPLYCIGDEYPTTESKPNHCARR